jgi:glycosyltransferase involved in cell wall biosynthesis
MLPGISVIVPIYNAEIFLEKCLSSLASQTYNNFQVILINDGSNDNSENICKKYTSNNPNWKLINQKNSGSQAARLNGVLEATNDYITFLDSDDYIDSDYYYKVAKKLEMNEPDIFCVAAKYETDIDNNKIVINNIDSGFYTDRNLNTILKKVIHYDKNYYDFGILPSNWSKFIKNNIAQNIYPKVNQFLKMGEDAVCTFSCISTCNNIEICNEISDYHYIYNPESIVHSYDSLYFERLRQLKINLNSLIKDSKNNQFLAFQLPYYYTFLIDIGIGFLHISKNPLKLLINLKKIKNIINICKMKDLIDFDIYSLENIPEKTRKRLKLVKERNFLQLLFYCIRI